MDSNPPGQLIGAQNSNSTSTTAARVVPLLQSLSRLEDLTSAIAMRLDPITNHVPSQDKAAPPSTTVTGRVNQLGDVLQYLLDNIEL